MGFCGWDNKHRISAANPPPPTSILINKPLLFSGLLFYADTIVDAKIQSSTTKLIYIQDLLPK